MEARFYTDQDVVYFRFSGKEIVGGKDLDDFRHLDFASDGTIVGIEFLDIKVKRGFHLSGIPDEYRQQIILFLEELARSKQLVPA